LIKLSFGKELLHFLFVKPKYSPYSERSKEYTSTLSNPKTNFLLEIRKMPVKKLMQYGLVLRAAPKNYG